MKKAALIIGAVALLMPAAALAANGDVAGDVYSTDIRAYINGTEVEAYNIGGRTVVALEDVSSVCSYNDDYRALIAWLEPDDIIEAHPEQSGSVGNVIGHIYESDIKVYMRNQTVPAYALNGKMAVALEDIGGDGEYSTLGGIYKWNEDERTIKLDMLYDNLSELDDLLTEKQRTLEIKDKELLFNANKLSPGGYSGVDSDIEPGLNVITTSIDDEEVTAAYVMRWDNCYYFLHGDGDEVTLENDDSRSVYYYIPEVMEKALSGVEPEAITREERIEYHIQSNLYTIIRRYDADEYTFLYSSSPNSHGGTEHLDIIFADGSEVSFYDEFEKDNSWGNVHFDDVVIDEENEKVTFSNHDKNYVIDLKSAALTEAE